MSALLGLDDLIKRASADDANLQRVWWRKSGQVSGALVTTAAGLVYSDWLEDGDVWQAGAAPAAVTAPTNATQGALPFTNPSGQLWMAGSMWIADARVAIGMYDRLLQCGGLSGTSTGVQTVGGAITRNTGGVGNRIFIEISTAIGATLRNLTVNYTDQSGNAHSAVRPLGGTNLQEAARFIHVPLASGDYGVRGVTSVQLDSSTGTAGDFAVIIARPIKVFGIPWAGAKFENPLSGWVAEIPSGACLSTYMTARVANASPSFIGYATLLDV